MCHTINATNNGNKRYTTVAKLPTTLIPFYGTNMVRENTETDLYRTEKHNIRKQNDPKDNL